ncbi:transcription initiation factor TFIID subunit 4-like [Manacus candei]|uniref:transcription initiation factor TFIID subunit 4-like n=1 Tax=Manacus candei TaxID=415023 RepID=UPI002226725C|nr:transcription initiation factor TFIID subunit 4-like [Manacus candei]
MPCRAVPCCRELPSAPPPAAVPPVPHARGRTCPRPLSRDPSAHRARCASTQPARPGRCRGGRGQELTAACYWLKGHGRGPGPAVCSATGGRTRQCGRGAGPAGRCWEGRRGRGRGAERGGGGGWGGAAGRSGSSGSAGAQVGEPRRGVARALHRPHLSPPACRALAAAAARQPRASPPSLGSASVPAAPRPAALLSPPALPRSRRGRAVCAPRSAPSPGAPGGPGGEAAVPGGVWRRRGVSAGAEPGVVPRGCPGAAARGVLPLGFRPSALSCTSSPSLPSGWKG